MNLICIIISGTESELIDEFETLLSATEVNFGSHQLLIVAGSVEDDEGNAVEVRAYKPKPKHGRTGAMLNQWELSMSALEFYPALFYIVLGTFSVGFL